MRDYRVEWTAAARADLVDIVRFIAQQDRALVARGVARQIERAARALRRFPQRGRRVPEQPPHTHPEMRETIVAAWRLMYRIDETTVHIVAVVDSRRELHAWLAQRMALRAPDEPA